MGSQLSSNGSAVRATTFDSYRRAIERVVLFMHENLEETWSLRDLASVAFMSPFHFNRVFRQITGIPPSQFLYALRLEAAKRLLLTSHFSVTDVCFEVGYNSLATFTNRFTHLVGLPPSLLRRLAEDSLMPYLKLLHDAEVERLVAAADVHEVSGRVKLTGGFEGIIFIGLFQTPIPQNRPDGCAVLMSPGVYRITRMRSGKYYLFAAAFDRPKDWLAILLPNAKSLFVGASRTPVFIEGDEVSGQTDIDLRPVQITDPPILMALPLMIKEYFDRGYGKFEGF
jgi:AraC family transcriptional regulator